MLEKSKSEYSNEVYKKFLNKHFYMKSEYCEDTILHLSLYIDYMKYKYRNHNLSHADFVEHREPEVIINNYKITKEVATPVITTNDRVDILATTSSIKPIIVGETTYQNDKLKGKNIPVIFVNNIPEFINSQFTIDPSSGTITRPFQWEEEDTLVII